MRSQLILCSSLFGEEPNLSVRAIIEQSIVANKTCGAVSLGHLLQCSLSRSPAAIHRRLNNGLYVELL